MSVVQKMRIMLLLCVLALWSTNMFAQGYFLERSDITLEYVRRDASDGSFRWRHKVRVIDETHSGNHTKYTTESVFTKQSGKPLYRSNVIETTWVENGTGNLRLDIGEAMASYIKARTGVSATGSGVLSSLPADIEPGDTLLPVVAQAKVGPLTYSVIVNNRKVLRRETIKVPAGTFDCIVVAENKHETGPGHNRNVYNVTWYCKGVGYVRHDTYVKGVLDTSEILQAKY
ncbi:MAG: hypothetical protein IKZ89_06470 [Bacteroidaceae bacterium]|nr:hypothetical protein [Bacteroidaceae bacterium]